MSALLKDLDEYEFLFRPSNVLAPGLAEIKTATKDEEPSYSADIIDPTSERLEVEDDLPPNIITTP